MAINKQTELAAAIDSIHSGDTVLLGGFNICGCPTNLLYGLAARRDIRNLTLVSEDFGDDTIIIVMTDMLKKQVYEKFSNALNVYSIREFTNEAIDVESPFGGELVDYGQGYEYLEKLVVKLDLILKGEEEI